MNKIIYKYSKNITKYKDRQSIVKSNQNINITTIAPNYPIRKYINA
jgi:hypothetical protein